MGGEGPNPAQLRRQSNRLRIAGAIIIIFLIFAGLFEITRRNGFHFFMTSSSMENGSPEQSPSSSALATTPTTSSSAPFASSTLHGYPPDNKELIASWCNLPPVAKQPVDGFKESGRLMGKDIRQRQIDRLSAAINVPTESHDDLGEFGRDRRWEKFDYLHKVLQAHFPRV